MSDALMRCRGTKSDDGTPCQSTTAISDAGFCPAHDPDRRAQMAAVRRAGGQARAKQKGGARPPPKVVPEGEAPPRPETLEDAVLWSSWAAHAVATGAIDSKICDGIVKAIREFRASLERRDLAAELQRLKAELAAFRAGKLRAMSR